MSYVKTQWVNNTTPINDTNLNKIEQGIYDNSLVVDAVTNTLNPTDTETYKTAELTEGQITDVIGVNDIIIKGQTSQNGTPTPSAPVDVNVVSGSNVIDIQNSDTNFAKEPSLIGYNVNSDGLGVSSGYAVSQKIFVNNETKFYYGLNTAFSNVSDSTLRIGFFDENDNFLSRVLGANIATSPIRNVTIPNNTKYIMIGASNNASNGFWREIEKVYYGFSSTIVPHQGKELPLDLPVENLFDDIVSNSAKSTYQNDIITMPKNTNNDPQFVIFSTTNYKKEKTYTISFDAVSDVKGTEIVLDGQPDSAASSSNYFVDKTFTINTTKARFSTTGILANDITGFRFYRTNGKKQFADASITISNIQMEEGSKANVYTPLGTEPIELCKIGNYQDYFYKDNSKWYLHKEIGKVVLDGNTSLSEQSQSGFYRYAYVNNKIKNNSSLANSLILFSNYFKAIIFNNRNTEVDETIYSVCNGISGQNSIQFNTKTFTSLSNFKTWLASNNVTLYYLLATPTDTEITDTTLISQLEAIYNAPLYEQTNITQENNDLPMVLDITACKDNINGIKAFIRK